MRAVSMVGRIAITPCIGRAAVSRTLVVREAALLQLILQGPVQAVPISLQMCRALGP